MAETLTTLKKAIKNDNSENVSISEINAAFDKFDNNFVPAAKIKATGTQSISTGSTTKVAYDSNVFDSFAARSEGAMADGSNDRINIRITGIYRVTASADFAFNANGYRALSIRKGSGTILKRITQDANTASSVDTAMCVSDEFVLTAGETIESTVLHTAGVALNLDPTIGGVADSVSLTAVWIGSVSEV